MITTQQAEAKRDRGMHLAEQKAIKDDPRWTDDAMGAVAMYCTAHPGAEFLTEDVRDFCAELDLADAPENAKAWGPLMRKAAKDGLIRKVGFAPARSSNMAPKVLWMAT